jgi:Flp pilus assembly protein TadG
MVIKRKKERGAALLESAITIPIILLVSVAIFDFGRAYQTWQVLTNAAREGARRSVITANSEEQIRTTVSNYVATGGLTVDSTHPLDVTVERSVDLGGMEVSRITVQYGFQFVALGPIMRMVDSSSDQGNALTMGAVAVMRNEN